MLAFLDVGPVSRGHCLLIPKVCYVEIDEVPAEVGAALGRVLPRLCAAVKSATGCDGLNVLQNNGEAAGQAVMHVHFHLIPRYKPAAAPGLEDAAPDPTQEPGFDFDWPAGELSDDDAAKLRGKIVEALDAG